MTTKFKRKKLYPVKGIPLYAGFTVILFIVHSYILFYLRFYFLLYVKSDQSVKLRR
jgi:hypothetical protein